MECQNGRMLTWTEMLRIHRFENTPLERNMKAPDIWFTCMLTCMSVTILFVQERLKQTPGAVTRRVFRSQSNRKPRGLGRLDKLTCKRTLISTLRFVPPGVNRMLKSPGHTLTDALANVDTNTTDLRLGAVWGQSARRPRLIASSLDSRDRPALKLSRD
jgi:hypothetical protein